LGIHRGQRRCPGAARIAAEKGKRFTTLVAAYSDNKTPCKMEQAPKLAPIIAQLMRRGIDEFRLTMGEIDWDERGRATQVRDLDPTITEWTGRVLTIASDLANPTVEDGLLHLRLKDSSDESRHSDQLRGPGYSRPRDKRSHGCKKGGRLFCLPLSRPARNR
jgi:hypothetical protein